MIKPQNFLFFTLVVMVSSCNPTQVTSSGQRSNQAGNGDGSLTNKAYIYTDTPSIKNSADAIFGGNLAALITTNTQLTSNCTMNFSMGASSSISGCVQSYSSNENPEQLVPRNNDGTWIFPAGSKEFYQVNSLYHVQQGIDKFFQKLDFAYTQVNKKSVTMPKSIPSYLPSSKLFWFKAITPNSGYYFQRDYLTVYSQCNLEKNAQFQPAGPDLCFGVWADHPNFRFVQDPSVIYHELGHALVSIMMNLRNGTSSSSYHALRSNLGGFGYDEGGSINEGLADYYSFVMNQRKHFGEWALGKSANASRPLTEADPVHISGINTTSEGRLSYPTYLMYDPNDPDHPYEDVHYAGQITSHYLVALTESFQSVCGLSSDTTESHDTATSYVLLLLAETLSELGDLKARGIDNYVAQAPYSGAYYFNNLDEEASYLWTQVVNPPTYRRFYQVFAKNIYKYISSGLCTSFTKNMSEKLLDDYGLLLFKTYNDNGNSTKDRSINYASAVSYISSSTNPTSVSESNRRKSVLVSKSLLSLASTDTTKNRSSYYLIDDKSTIQGLLTNLLFKGYPVNLSTDSASTDYNNGNVKISPGEVVAIIPNLYNASNSTMAGVQILANDWDHVNVRDTATGNFNPCVVDDAITSAQGGEAGLTCATTKTDYKRLVKQTNGLFPSEAVAPVCLVQLDDGSNTKWVSQNEFRKKQGLSLLDKDCLGYSASGTASVDDYTFNPHECLVRVLPGANIASFSLISPQKSYIESVRLEGEVHKFNVGNAIMMEVNKRIPPGTKFRCRLRARFSNCSDCFTDPSDASLAGDDFIDADFNGAKPFKIINFDFDVND